MESKINEANNTLDAVRKLLIDGKIDSYTVRRNEKSVFVDVCQRVEHRIINVKSGNRRNLK